MAEYCKQATSLSACLPDCPQELPLLRLSLDRILDVTGTELVYLDELEHRCALSLKEACRVWYGKRGTHVPLQLQRKYVADHAATAAESRVRFSLSACVVEFYLCYDSCTDAAREPFFRLLNTLHRNGWMTFHEIESL